MTTIIHRFSYPRGEHARPVTEPMECSAKDALEMLAENMETARDRDAYIETLVQQPDGVTWLAEDWRDRVRQYERDRLLDEIERRALERWGRVA